MFVLQRVEGNRSCDLKELRLKIVRMLQIEDRLSSWRLGEKENKCVEEQGWWTLLISKELEDMGAQCARICNDKVFARMC